MRINQNISAMNTHASMVKADSAMSKSLERLSSGYRINRAADDAAGLAISEKMRGQISGLKQATKNAQDGISLLQTAEGNLNESHSILQRMRELADQAANGTVTDSDRAEIQKEMNQLTKEVDRIAKDTEFNTMKLLRGQRAAVSMSGTVTTNTATGVSTSAMAGGTAGAGGTAATGTFKIDASIAANDTIKIGAKTYTMVANGTDTTGTDNIALGAAGASMLADTTAAILAKINGASTANGLGDKYTASSSVAGTIDLTATAHAVDTSTLDVTQAAGAPTDSVMAGGTADTTPATAASGTFSFDRQLVAGDKITVGATEYTMVASGAGAPGAHDIVLGADMSTTIDNIVAKLTDVADGVTATAAATKGTDGKSIRLVAAAVGTAGNSVALSTTLSATSRMNDHITLTMQIGANAGQNMDVDINNMDAGSLKIGRGADGNLVAAGVDATQGLDVTSSTTASNALTAIDNAINTVSSERSKLGAFQNRLDHTVSNLSTAAENLSASESRIRDVDMAEEMSNFSRAQILMQASTAMMAQANQKPQAVLKLLG